MYKNNVVQENNVKQYELRQKMKKALQVGEYYEIPKTYYPTPPHAKRPWHRKIWNKRQQEIIGRCYKGWLKLLLFFVALYLAMAIVYMICWQIFTTKFSPNKASSSKFNQPGLMFQPICPLIKDHPCIIYNENVNGELLCYVKEINKFLGKYGKRRTFGDCMESNHYGYPSRQPCLFLKLNRRVGFKVNAYEKAQDLPASAPKQLKTYIEELPETDKKKQVWISCHTSKSGITFSYFPKQAISGSSLEFNTTTKTGSSFYSKQDYDRIIAVQLTNVPVNTKVLIKCQAWAKNLERDKSSFIHSGRGFLSIELQINT